MASVCSIAKHIEITPDGKPQIARNGVSVQNIIVLHEQLGQSPQQIVSAFSGLTMADVHAALAFYHDQSDKIQKSLRGDEVPSAM